MVRKRKVKLAIHILRGKGELYTTLGAVADILTDRLGLESSQAYNCERLIRLTGSYCVYTENDPERALMIVKELRSEGLSCELLHK